MRSQEVLQASTWRDKFKGTVTEELCSCTECMETHMGAAEDCM
jgi:hypothetical protein